VTNLGHNHPKVVAAAHDQLDRFIHSGCVYRYEPLVELAEALGGVAPPGIDKFMFANSGAEAVEGAVKLAKRTTGRQGLLAFRGGFHGRTMGSVTYTTSNARYRDGYHPLLGSVFITPFPHPYGWGMSEADAIDHSLWELEMLFRHQVSPQHLAAFLLEPVQGEGGYYPAPARFLDELGVIADRHGILVIYDEVQTGFGRTAEWFAADHYAAKPDIIVLGKGIANGLPLSAYGASTDRMDAWPKGSHGTTFGGNPVACAAALAVREVMGDLLPHARRLSELAFERWEKLAADHPGVGDVRGLGLMIGIELVKDAETREPDPELFTSIQRYCLERELVLIDCGPDGNIIRFLPPLVTTNEELDWAIDLVDDALTSVGR
jgi:4-aminobutyrate aminotransferase